ncbi:hypothetical protein LTR08_003910 [Meristemomyces frigidus]|nr:hypothetical protein LTR08_003910 [Meristemomyces frigidus]
MPNQSLPSIQLATVEDIPEILAMIRELAAHEKAEDKVLATEASLKRTLTFAPSASASHTNAGYARTLILRVPASASATDVVPGTAAADVPAAVAGMAMYFNNYSTWRAKPGVYLEDLFVRPRYRQRGYGKLLLQALARETLRIDGGRLEWCCLRWNEASLRFYESIGARQMGDWVSLRVDGGELEALARGRVGEKGV